MMEWIHYQRINRQPNISSKKKYLNKYKKNSVKRPQHGLK